jgi:hypothetical protein
MRKAGTLIAAARGEPISGEGRRLFFSKYSVWEPARAASSGSYRSVQAPGLDIATPCFAAIIAYARRIRGLRTLG